MSRASIIAVCISDKNQMWDLPEIPFYCHIEGYDAKFTPRDNNNMHRINYFNKRYGDAINTAIQKYPRCTDLLLIDTPFLQNKAQINDLVSRYYQHTSVILGASIWCWERTRIIKWIRYYDFLSVPELAPPLRWYKEKDLPVGLMRTTGVGKCWIFSRKIWERTGRFLMPSPMQAGGSRCLDTTGYEVLLDCDTRLWIHLPAPSLPRRILNSIPYLRRFY